MIELGEHFSRDERGRHSEWLQQQRWFIRAKEQQARKEEIEDRADENSTMFAAAVMMATDAEIKRFEAKLDQYDEVIVKELMANQEKLDAVDARLVEMLERAYTMQDGRRVFKTADGAQVFDEFGKLVPRKALDYDLIGSNRPSWDTFQPLREEQGLLEAERQRIFEFQERVDAARDQIAEVEMPKSGLDELDADLATAMPPSVSSRLPGYAAAANAPDHATEFRSPANSTTFDRTGPRNDPHVEHSL